MIRLTFLILLLVVGCGPLSNDTEQVLTTNQPGDSTVTPEVDLATPENRGFTETPLLKWQKEIGPGLASPAQLVNGNLIVANNDAVMALDPSTGDERWRLEPDQGIW